MRPLENPCDLYPGRGAALNQGWRHGRVAGEFFPASNLISRRYFAKFIHMKLCAFPKKTDEEKNKILTARKNSRSAAAFDAIPYADRIVFVPHCMRNLQKCKAKEMGSYYVCAECGACKIVEISKRSGELGYKALYILKGGKAVKKLTEELKPRAVLGVACYFEGVMGMEESEKHGLVAQFTPLLKDGCVDTDVDLAEVFKALGRKAPERLG